MSWRLAKSLETLRAQVNKQYPGRSKASDGTIGDAAHSSRASDHNPHVKDGATGVVTALDLTHDPKNGVDIQALANALVASKDSRIKYIICNGRIVSGSGQKSPAWQWRPYTGKNAHAKHVHISVKSAKSSYDDTSAWALPGAAAPKPAEPASPKPKDAILKLGSKGPFVAELQANLARLGYAAGEIDGHFGERTESAVKTFQAKVGLTVDGWAGPRTIEAIGKTLAEKATAPKIVAAVDASMTEAEAEVEKKTGRWQWVTSLIGGSGLGFSWLAGMDWQAIVVVGGLLIVMLVILLLLRRQIVAAVKEIKTEVGG
jgi:hypothetical protein